MFLSFFNHNLRRRLCDGFSIGYNLIFPLVMIWILGLLTRNLYTGEVTSYQYYSVVLIPYCTVLGLVTAAYAGKDDAYSKTAERVLTAPISVRTIVLSKTLSCSIVFFLCSAVTVGITAIIWKVQVLSALVPILFFYLALSFCVGAVGTLVGLGLHNFLAFKNIISIPVSIFAVFAGTFYPFRSSSKVITALIKISPFTMINRSIFLALYDNQHFFLWIAGCVMLLAGCIVLVITVKNFKREEYINGVIPGYEK